MARFPRFLDLPAMETVRDPSLGPRASRSPVTQETDSPDAGRGGSHEATSARPTPRGAGALGHAKETTIALSGLLKDHLHGVR
jgi:hypothetical protein